MNVRVFAPAKINLTLKVGSPRTDGRHPLESVVMFADIGDWIEVAPAPTLSMCVAGPFAARLAGEADNLVLRAARALSVYAPAQGAALVLEKNLPIASGIGGGSSDAAAALKALRTLWRLELSDDDLARIARDLGADAPVCVFARSAIMRGAGEIYEAFDAPRLHAVLVNPLVPLSTADVYRAFDLMGLGGGFAPGEAPRWADATAALAAIKALGNDLEAPARALCPAIVEVVAAVTAEPGVRHVGLSGSGATMFALVQDAVASQALAATLAALYPAWWVRAAVLGAA